MSLSNEDQTFLKTYDDSKYAKPSVTADMVIFSRFSDGSLQVLLIRRGKSPYKDQFALPGGFVNPDESVDQAAAGNFWKKPVLTALVWNRSVPSVPQDAIPDDG